MALLQKAYLGATPLFREQSWFEDTSNKPVDVSSTVTVTADATAHVKGAWSELVASTSANASLLILRVAGIPANNVNTATLLDIATGASGSESAFISNIAVGGAEEVAIPLPVKIASGTRLSARIQSVVTGGKTATVEAYTFDMGDYSYAPTSFDVIGTDTATSQAVAMSGSAGTWVEITASTANPYKAVIVVPATNGSPAGIRLVELRLGSGASGSEAEIGRTYVDFTNTEAALSGRFLTPLIAGSVASGTRLSIRHDISSNQSSHEVSLIGIR